MAQNHFRQRLGIEEKMQPPNQYNRLSRWLIAVSILWMMFFAGLYLVYRSNSASKVHTPPASEIALETPKNAEDGVSLENGDNTQSAPQVKEDLPVRTEEIVLVSTTKPDGTGTEAKQAEEPPPTENGQKVAQPEETTPAAPAEGKADAKPAEEPVTVKTLHPMPTPEEVEQSTLEIQAELEKQMGRLSTFDPLVFKKVHLEKSETEKDILVRYTHLKLASEAAANGGEFEQALAIADKMGQDYTVDLPVMKAQLLVLAAERIEVLETAALFARFAFLQTEEMIHQEQYDSAEIILKAIDRLLRRQPWPLLQVRVQPEQKRVFLLRKEYLRLQEAFAATKLTPPSPEANQVVGEFKCFMKGEWETGLPYLSQGEDPFLKTVALEDLGDPSTPDRQLALAKQWITVAYGQRGKRKTLTQYRARYWLERAQQKTSKLGEGVVEELLARLPSPTTDIRVRLIIDGRDAIHISREGMKWSHISWGWPSEITINTIPWNPQAQPIFPNKGKGSFIPKNADLDRTTLVKISGRAKLEAVQLFPEEIVVELNDDDSLGHEALELMVRVPMLP